MSSFLPGIFSRASNEVKTPPAVRELVDNPFSERITKVVLSVIASLVSFFFLPAEAAFALSGLVALLSTAYFFSSDTQQQSSSGVWTAVGNMFFTHPRQEREAVDRGPTRSGFSGWWSNSTPPPVGVTHEREEVNRPASSKPVFFGGTQTTTPASSKGLLHPEREEVNRDPWLRLNTFYSSQRRQIAEEREEVQ